MEIKSDILFLSEHWSVLNISTLLPCDKKKTLLIHDVVFLEFAVSTSVTISATSKKQIIVIGKLLPRCVYEIQYQPAKLKLTFNDSRLINCH